MADSDSDDGDPVTNELEVFQDEIKSTLISSLSDSSTFRSLITEAEHLRNAYKQDPASLNKAVLKAIFELPFSTTNQSMTFHAYFERMGELFERYNPLIKSLKRDKKTQQEGGIAVADPLIQLMSSGKLSRDDWAHGKGRAELAAVLNQHGIIAESQVTIATNTIDEFCHAVESAKLEGAGTTSEPAIPHAGTTSEPAIPPAGTTSEPAIPHAGTTSEPAIPPPDVTSEPTGDSECTPKSLKRKHEKLCTDKFSRTFTHTGGKLQYWMSDDYLEIPEGAIPEGQEWKITGNIHTSLDDYTDLLKEPKSEVFVAAINDYEVEGGHWFEVPVKVVIHHSISNKAELENLCIRLHDKELGFIEVLKSNGANGKGPWYEIDGPRIVVYTYHFTKIICSCTVDPNTEYNANAVEAYAYGKMTQKDDNSYIATIELYVHVLKGVEQLPVFWEAFSRQKDLSGYRLLNSKPFAPALQQIRPTDQISTDLGFINRDWTIQPGSDELRPKLVGDCMPCLAHTYNSVNVFTFMLHGRESCISGFVDFSLGQSSVRLPLQMQYVPPTSAPSQATTATTASLASFQAATTIQAGQSGIAPISEDAITLSDTKLFAVGEKLKSKTRAKVGLKLGLSLNEVERWQSNSNNSTEQRTSFDVLRSWRDQQPRGSKDDLTKAATILCRALDETGNTAALKELKNPTNAVQVAAD